MSSQRSSTGNCKQSAVQQQVFAAASRALSAHRDSQSPQRAHLLCRHGPPGQQRPLLLPQPGLHPLGSRVQGG